MRGTIPPFSASETSFTLTRHASRTTRCFKLCLDCALPPKMFDPSRVVQLAFTRCNVSKSAETMAQAYFQLLEEGIIDRPRLVAGL